jgi:hypothetical protein
MLEGWHSRKANPFFTFQYETVEGSSLTPTTPFACFVQSRVAMGYSHWPKLLF